MELLKSILHDLGIEPGALLLNIISFVILIWLMKKLLFKPIGEFIEHRQKHVTTQLDDAEAQRKQAKAEYEDVLANRESLLEAASHDAQDVRHTASKEADEIRRIAREQAREMELAARSAVGRETAEAAKTLRADVNVTASAMASSVLRDALSDERHHALLDQFIADVEKMAAKAQGQQ